MSKHNNFQYSSKPIKCNAIQWNGNNVEEIKEFIREQNGNLTIILNSLNIYFPTLNQSIKSLRIPILNYLIIYENGNIEVMDKIKFETVFTKKKNKNG